MLVQLFGLTLAVGVLGSSFAMMLMGHRFQVVEAAAYAGERRPWWFFMLSFTVIAFYIAALSDFLNADKTWAGWLLMVVIPIGWAVKGLLVTFNPRGRKAVISIADDRTWIRLGLARLPIAMALAGLASLV